MRKYWGKKIVTLFAGLITLVIQAQTVQHWTEHDQLSDRSVHSGIQGSDGFIWLATWNGLDRFDGYEFVRFGKSTSVALSSNYINDLVEDSSACLWLATDAGINVLNLRTYEVQQFYPDSQRLQSLGTQRYINLHHASDGAIWVADEQGMVFCHREKGRFEAILNPLDSSGSFGREIVWSEDGSSLWIGTEGDGCHEVDLKTGKWKRVVFEDGEYNIWHVSPGLDHSVLIHAKEQSFVLDSGSTEFSVTSSNFPKDAYLSYVDYKNDQWVIGSERKKLFRQIGDGKWKEIVLQQLDDGSNVHFTSIFEDQSHNLWVCSNNGLFKITNETTRFRARFGLTDSLIQNTIPSYRGMYEDENGDLYFGGYGGLFVIRQGMERAVKMMPNTFFGFYSILPYTSDSLWLITEGNGIMAINKRTFESKTYSHPLSEKFKHKYKYFISGIQDPNDQTLWLAEYSGILHFEPRNYQYSILPIIIDSVDVSRFRIKQFYLTEDNHFWLACSEGMIELDENRKPLRWLNTDSEYGRLSANEVNAVVEGKDGYLWIGLADGGVDKLDRNTGEIINYSKENGLCDNKVGCLLVDGNGYLWASTNFGISVIHPRQDLIFNYYHDDGLAHNEFNHGSALKLRNGQLVFGGIDGLSFCQPQDTLDQANTRILMSSAEYFNDQDSLVRLFGRSNITSGIYLPADNQHLNLKFAFTDFLRVGKNVYAYKLEGYDKDWTYIGTQNQVRFASLPAGDYQLIVRGAGSKGSWSRDEVVIPVYVAQVFYKSIGFILGVTLLFAAIAWAIVFQRIQRYKELARMRIGISSDLHDDVGSVLTRVAMQAEFIEEDVAAEQKVVLVGIVESCRTALSNMRDVVWSIDSRNLNVASLYDKMNEHANRMFENSQFNCEIQIDENLESFPLNPSEKKELFFIFKESVHNILRHSNGDKVHIHVHHDGKHLELSIFDNGQQENGEKISAGSGTKNMEMRARSIGAEFHLTKDNGYRITVVKKLSRLWWR